MNTPKEILEKGSPAQVKTLFLFNKDTHVKIIQKKFSLWARYFFPRFFTAKDAPFHNDMDRENILVYLGEKGSYLNIAFRDSAKTTRTKIFIAYAIANDENHYRRYFKVLSKDIGNSKQSVTDVYNMLISRRVKALYPEIFEKSELKREETMSSFTTAGGIKMISDSVGTDQRGDIQEESRPDFIWFDDIETRMTLTSAPITFKIWQNIEEARTGLAKGGGSIYTANYISERGNVHKLIEKIDNQAIIPIAHKVSGKWVPTWERFSADDVNRIQNEAEDFEGEYLCKPSASMDVFFKREAIEKQVKKEPIDEIAGLKIYRKYDAKHRIGSGHDVGGGVGLDHSTSVFMDFDTYPIQVIATYKNNEIKPDEFAYEIARQCKRFGENYAGVEKNYGSTVDILKTIYDTSKMHRHYRNDQRIVFQNPTEYGWKTDKASKVKMLADIAKAVEDGIIELNDSDLIDECKNYSRDDLMDKEVDPRLTTRHFDLLTAAAICLQMNQFVKKPVEDDWDEFLGVPTQQRANKQNPAR
jgi:hypothetical protein